VAPLFWIPDTGRAVQGLRLWEVFFYTVRPVRLLEFIVPYPFGPTWALDPPMIWATTIFRGKSVGLFATLYCGAFAVIALFSSGGIRSRGARAGLALFWFGFVGSVLPSLVPAAWAQAKSPIALRNPEKLAVAMIL